MSDQKIDKDMSDAEIEKLFNQDNTNNPVAQLESDQKVKLTNKIVRKARRETSIQTITEYSLINFWTGIIEFMRVFCTLLDPKAVKENENNKNSKDKK